MTRRLLAVFVAATALLAACGDDDTQTGSAETQPSASAAEAAPFPRTVAHAMGDTEIPDRPERVVVLDTGELDSAVALGVVPVGAVRAPVDSGFLEYLAAQTTETELTASTLWERLSGVQSGDVHAVPDDHWMLGIGIGIGAANLVLDDIESLLLDA